MKSRVFRNFALACTFCIIFLSPFATYAQWHPDSSRNTPVCDTIGQQDTPQGCSDGANGAIFAWRDTRNGTSQIFAQHLDANGVALWPHNGVMLSKLTGIGFQQTSPIITTDDSGGAYVVWGDARYSTSSTPYGTSLFAQHILANGTLAYPDTGLPVGVGLNTGCTNPTLCDDGFGGAFVAYQDNRAATASTRPDIWMNRLWTQSVKYGLTTTGTGILSYYNPGHGVKPYYYFHDPNAHFKLYLAGLSLLIPGKGSFIIETVSSDTQLLLKTNPPVGTYSYSVAGLCGLPIDTVGSKQTNPCIIGDGMGGCFLAWTTYLTNPSAIYGTHIDSTCKALWDAAPQAGFQLFKSTNTSESAGNVWLGRDGTQLLLTWQVLSASANSQQIYADRMRNSNALDTLFEWGSPVEVSGDIILDKTNPQIFGDDSAISGTVGTLVPFVDAGPGPTDNYNISMVRVVAGGGNLIPPIGNPYWFFEQKPHAHNNFKAVKVTDPSDNGIHTGVLAVWTDPWDGTDTMLYAQRMDRNGRNYFPTAGTSNTWGLAISGNSPSGKRWSAKQPCIIPRSDGAIVGWADFRTGKAAIYSQLILNDGAFWIPFDTTPPVLTVVSSRPGDNGSACNSQFITVRAVDTGLLATGIDSIAIVSENNMQVQIPAFTKGAGSVTFTVSVTDSLLNGSATVTALDTNFLSQGMNFTYCTIADTNTPTVTWDSLSLQPWIAVHVRDTGAWSRGLGSITVSNATNVAINGTNLPNEKITISDSAFSFDTTVSIIDSTKAAHFAIKATGASGISSSVYNFSYVPAGVNSVSQPSAKSISLSIFPNPVLGSTTMRLDGATEANVTVTDILGRTVDEFLLEGSHEWQPGSLASGTYIVRAVIGDLVISKRIVKQ